MTSGTSSSGKTSATTAEEPFEEIKSLLFSSSSSSASMDTTYTLSILHKALAHPRIFAGYAELHSNPLIVETLSKSKLGLQMLETLQLFAFGVYEDYVKEKEKYCTLNVQEVMKLRVLTVIALVQQSSSTNLSNSGGGSKKNSKKKKSKGKKGGTAVSSSSVSYELLYQSLDIPPTGIRQLEDVLIHSIYTHAIVGKLDQRHMCLRILPGGSGDGFLCASRDVNVEKDVPVMIEVLEEFYKKGQNLLATLEDSAEHGREVREKDALYWMEVELRIRKCRLKASNHLSVAAAGGGGKGKAAAGGMMLTEEGIIAATAAEGGAGGAQPSTQAGWADWLTSSAAGRAAAAAGGGGGGGGSSRGRQSKRSRGGGSGGAGPGAGSGPAGGGAYGRF